MTTGCSKAPEATSVPTEDTGSLSGKQCMPSIAAQQDAATHLAAAQLQGARKTAHGRLALHPVNSAAHSLIEQHAALHAWDCGIQSVQELLRAGLLEHGEPGLGWRSRRNRQLFQDASLVEQGMAAGALVRDGLACTCWTSVPVSACRMTTSGPCRGWAWRESGA